MNKIVILGAGFAGLMAALRLSRTLPKGKASITLVNASEAFVERTRLHQVATGQHPKTYTIADMLRGTHVQFTHGWAKALLSEQKRVVIATTTGEQMLDYDYLIVALGSRTNRDHVTGLGHAYTLDAPDMPRLAEALSRTSARGGRVLVIGGGLTGIEAATEIAEAFPSLQVALATHGRLGDDLSNAGAAHVRAVFARHHIAIHDHAAIKQVEPNGAVLASGERLSFDVCINCAGLVAAPFAREAGLAVNHAGQLLIDAHLRAISYPEIFGVGDAAAFEDEANMPLRMACATALPMAAHVADNLTRLILGDTPTPFGFGYVIRCISLGRSDALVQTVDARDVPQPRVITGQLAVWVKEGILRYVTTALAAEKHFSLYRSPNTIIAQSVIQPTQFTAEAQGLQRSTANLSASSATPQ
jgi:NADH dehydrogenase FAD-containing subunit